MSTRRVVRNCLLALILPALVVVPVAGYRWQVDREGRAARDAVIARIEATDPRWRWEDVEADRPPVPDQENAAYWSAKLDAVVGPDIRYRQSRVNGRSILDASADPNRMLDDEGYRLLNRAFAGMDDTLPILKTLSRCTRGRRELVGGPPPTKVKIREDQYPGLVVNYLEWEAERTVPASYPECHAILVHCMLNVARIEGDPPREGWQGRRLRAICWAVRRLERALAMELRPADLPGLQDAFDREAGTDRYRAAVRHLRAEYDVRFQAFESGERSLPYDLYGSPGRSPGIDELYGTWAYRPHLPTDWAATLEIVTAAVSAADRPQWERPAAWAAVPKPPPPTDGCHLFSNQAVSEVEFRLQESLLASALSHCAVAALAAEPHRLLTGSWPTTLAEIPKSILPTMPLDPATGGPLRIARRPDGITVYSIGADGVDNDGSPPLNSWSPGRAGDIVFRVYDPAHRRLPALPPANDRP